MKFKVDFRTMNVISGKKGNFTMITGPIQKT